MLFLTIDLDANEENGIQTRKDVWEKLYTYNNQTVIRHENNNLLFVCL